MQKGSGTCPDPRFSPGYEGESKKAPAWSGGYFSMVGTTGFEPVTSWSRTRRTTKLCYVPMLTQIARAIV